MDNDKFSFASGKFTYDGTTVKITGTITANRGTVGGWTIGDNGIAANGFAIYSDQRRFRMRIDAAYAEYGDAINIYDTQSNYGTIINSAYTYICEGNDVHKNTTWYRYDGVWIYRASGDVIIFDRNGIYRAELNSETGYYEIKQTYMTW